MKRGDVYLDRALDLSCANAYGKLMLQMNDPNSKGDIAVFMLQKTAYTNAGTGFNHRKFVYTIPAQKVGFCFTADVIFLHKFSYIINRELLPQAAGRIVYTFPSSLIDEICRHAMTSPHLIKIFRKML